MSDGFAAAGFGFSAGRAFCAGSGFCCANAVVAAKTMIAANFISRESTGVAMYNLATIAVSQIGGTHGRSVDDVHRNPFPKPLPAVLCTADRIRREHPPRL